MAGLARRMTVTICVILTLPAAHTNASPPTATTGCGSWKIESAPLPKHAIGELSGVAPLSATDVWAVGLWGEQNGSGQGHPLIEHWNGTQWRVTPTPAPSTTIAELWAVAGTGKSVWAVGLNGPKGQQVPLIEQHTSC